MGMNLWVQKNVVKMQSSHRQDGLICVGARWGEAEEILYKSGLMIVKAGGTTVVEYHHAEQAKAVLRLNGFEVEE